MIKVNIGCAKRNFGSDWYHIDASKYEHIHSHDIENLPFKDNSVDLLYASHVLGYFDNIEVNDLLKKWHSVLKSGGILRLAVPNFKNYCKMYYENKITIEQCLGPIFGKWYINDETIIYHKTTYDEKSLKNLLENNGFKNIKLWDWREVEHGKYDDYSQSYIPHMDKENGIHMSLNIECNK